MAKLDLIMAKLFTALTWMLVPLLEKSVCLTPKLWLEPVLVADMATGKPLKRERRLVLLQKLFWGA